MEDIWQFIGNSREDSEDLTIGVCLEKFCTYAFDRSIGKFLRSILL